jgi:hypothetical protein
VKVSEQARAKSEAGKQIIRDLLPTEIPKHGPQFIVPRGSRCHDLWRRVCAYFFKEDVPTLAICVIAEHVEEDNGFESCSVVSVKLK